MTRSGVAPPLPAPTLVIEAATYRASAAVVHGGSVLAELTVAMRGEHQERLMPAVAAVLEAAGVRATDLERVVCGAGPGSFTSLRIAASLAKGLVTARPGRGPRLAAVSSLALLAGAALDRLEPGGYLVSLDALRGDRYAALVTVVDGETTPEGASASAGRRLEIGDDWPVAAVPRPEEDVRAWARARGATILGPGCAIDAWPEARGMIRVWAALRDVDAATWEPDYGRPPEASVHRAAAGAGGAPPAGRAPQRPAAGPADAPSPQ